MELQSLLDATGLTYKQYDAWRFKNFTVWAFTQSRKYGLSSKLLIRNDGVLNWYEDQWLRLVEQQFLKDNADLLKIQSQRDVQEILMTYPDELLNYYPRPLLEQFKIKAR